MGCLWSGYENMGNDVMDPTVAEKDVRMRAQYNDYEPMMKRGQLFIKHNYGPLKGFTNDRWVQLSEDGQKIIWKKMGEEAYEEIYLYNITGVAKGIATDVMKKRAKQSNEQLCWSIVTEDRTLDLQADNQEVRDKWVDGLRLALCVTDPLSPEEIQMSDALRVQAEERSVQRREAALKKNENRRAELRALREQASLLNTPAARVHSAKLTEA